MQMRWKDVENQQPRLAELGRKKLGNPGVVLVGSIRADGTPRISPAEPLFWREDLWLSMGWHTRKAEDLMRDSRILVHSIVTSREGADGEFKLRGRAILETDDDVQKAYADTVTKELGWTPMPGNFHLFRIQVEDLTFIRWAGANDQYVTRWPPGREFVRHGTSATSVGSPEPYTDLLS